MKKATSTAALNILICCAFLCPQLTAQKNAALPLADVFIPSGYMEDAGAMVENFPDKTRPDSLSIKVVYTPGGSGWGGIFWQYPANNWCKEPGYDLRKYSKLTFWVRGGAGGENVKFKIGHDCAKESYALKPPMPKRLTAAWEKVTIDLSGKDLTNITGAFAWLVEAKANLGKVVIFYLDDIQFE